MLKSKVMRAIPLVFLICACDVELHPRSTPPVTDTDMCDAAEANLKLHECKDRADNPMWVNKKGEKFGDTCRTAQVQATIFLNPKCVAGAATCEEANKCPQF